MDERVTLNERQAQLVKNYDRMNAKGKDILLKFSVNLVDTYAERSGKVLQFTPARRAKLA